MADRGVDIQSLTTRVPGVPVIQDTGEAQLFAQLSTAFFGIAHDATERVAMERIDTAAKQGIEAGQSDDPELRRANSERNQAYNRGVETAMSQRLTAQMNESIRALEFAGPEDVEGFTVSVDEEIRGIAGELEQSIPHLAGAWEQRARTDASTALRRITRRAQITADRNQTIGYDVNIDSMGSFAASNSTEIIEGGGAADSLASKMIEFNESLFIPSATGAGSLLTEAERNQKLNKAFATVGFEAALGTLESSIQIPGGPGRIADQLEKDELTLLFHDPKSGEFTLIQAPVSRVLGNRARSQLITHARTLQTKQDQGNRSIDSARIAEIRGMARDSLDSALLDPTNVVQLPDDASMIMAFGEVGAIETAQQFDTNLKIGQFTKEIEGLTVGEISELEGNLKPSGPGFSVEKDVQNAVAIAASVEREFRRTDGGAYGERQDPSLEALRLNIQGEALSDASKVRLTKSYNDRQVAIQAEAGIPSGMIKLLPNQVAQQFAQVINNAPNALAQSEIVNTLDDFYGKDHFGRIMGQLQAENVEPSVIPMSNISPKDRRGGQLYALMLERLGDGGRQRLVDEMPQDDPSFKSNLDIDLQNEMATMLTSFGENNGELQRIYAVSTQNLAYFLAGSTQNLPASEAVERAIEIVGGENEFVTSGGYALQIPLDDTKIDVEAAKKAASNWGAIAKKVAKRIPDHLIPPDPGGMPKKIDRRKQLVNAIIAEGGLQTQPDQYLGVTLMGPDATPMVNITWEELSALINRSRIPDLQRPIGDI